MFNKFCFSVVRFSFSVSWFSSSTVFSSRFVPILSVGATSDFARFVSLLVVVCLLWEVVVKYPFVVSPEQIMLVVGGVAYTVNVF